MSMADSSKPPSKRLLFDRRYGWVIDEWKDPSEEALAGGRGMFCILPLTKALTKTVSQSISLAASSAVKAMERTELVLPQVVQDGLNNGLHKFMSSLQNPEFSCFLPQGKFAITCYQSLFSSTYGKKSSESQMA
ncbi:uncharacterized protein LOC133859376 [Alnus glutinosa]|uniref:uncharacterized protein LOC133859376 n=1 Tax=Alnus glutinosa TaxID=3517 RepID=UPI002D79C039|nr:uncharacterized protein LOC133859376 [Alnus glutinosa]